MRSLIRIFKFAFQDIGRNIGLSAMTVFILVLMLLSVNILWSVEVATKEAIRLVKDQVNVSLYLVPNVMDKKIGELKSFISTFTEVTDVKVLSRDEVLQTFKNRHQLSVEVLQALNELGGNPFGPTLVVKTKEPGDYKRIIDALNVPEYAEHIEGKSFEGHEEALERIQTITTRVERAGFVLSGLFAIIAFLIIFNTIRVAIHTQRVEISIKRLVGANNWFIRGPYLIESVIFTLASILIISIILYFGLARIDHYISVVFPNGFTLTNYYRSHMLYLVGIQTLAVLLLTISSSSLAMRRQLKV